MSNTVKNRDFVLYCDLDGVLFHWDGRVKELLGDQFETASKGHKWAAITKYDADVQPFYETLPKFDDTDQLWTFITSTFEFYNILSACGSTPKNAADQKRRLVRAHFGEVNTIIVKKGPDKAMYANPKSILIDDRDDRVLVPWRAAGGIAVKHTSALDTIEQLKKILQI